MYPPFYTLIQMQVIICDTSSGVICHYPTLHHVPLILQLVNFTLVPLPSLLMNCVLGICFSLMCLKKKKFGH